MGPLERCHFDSNFEALLQRASDNWFVLMDPLLTFFAEEYRQIDLYLTSRWNARILISSIHVHLLKHQRFVNQVAEAVTSKLPINTPAHG